jgi:mannose-6-phosphate isomerase-like protein (cupin superfamily)
MPEEISLGPGTTLRVIADGEERLELEATYAGNGTPPPTHLHPAQEERFEVLQGAMRVRVGGRESALAAGETLDIPRETPHQMWNDTDQPAVVKWETMPAGRTLDWFRELAAVLRGEGRERPEDLLADYSDVFRLTDD